MMRSVWRIIAMVGIICSCNSSEPPIVVEEGMKKINNGEIYYKTMGTGEPVVIVHGGPGLDHSYLLPQMQELAKDYQLIFYDQRASGRSSRDVPEATISLRGFVEDIEGLRQLLDLDSIHLMAHSWGGIVAMNYAIDFPQNLKSLTLINSVGASTATRQQENEIINDRITPDDSVALSTITSSAAYQNNEPQAFEEVFRILYRRQFYRPELADSLTLTFQPTYRESSRALHSLGPDLRYYNLYSRLTNVQVPTLIVYGDYDPNTTLAISLNPAFKSCQ